MYTSWPSVGHGGITRCRIINPYYVGCDRDIYPSHLQFILLRNAMVSFSRPIWLQSKSALELTLGLTTTDRPSFRTN